MTAPHEPALWPQLIRHNTVVLVSLVGVLGVAIVAFVSWSHRTSEASLDIINNYHLASAHNCAAASEQIQHLLADTIFTAAKVDEVVKSQLLGHGNEPHANVSFHIAKMEISKLLELQRRFADTKFTYLAERLERLLANFTADYAKHPTQEVDFPRRIGILQSVLRTLHQFERLHMITHEDMLAKLAESKTRNVGILIAIVLAVALIGYLFMRRGLGAIDAVIKRQVNIEQALRTSEERFRAVVNGTAAAISLKDAEGKLLLVNDRFASWFAAEPSDIVGRKVDNILGPSEMPGVEASDAEVRNNKTSIREEDRTYPDGVQRSVVIHKSPITDSKGLVTAIATVLTDITDRKQAEVALRQSEARISDILRIAPEAIISTDSNGTILVFNDAAENIFGYERDDIIGQPLDVLLPEDVRPVHGDHIKSFIEGKESVRQMGMRGEISGRKRDGSVFPAGASISKLQSGGETVLTVTMQDITERKQSEEDLRTALVDAERANQAKTEFLATMSHELRTPLNAIIGFSETMAGQFFGPLGSERYIDYAHDIEISGEHLLHLVNDLLDLSAIESGEHRLNKENLIFQVVLEDCAPIVKERAKQKGVAYTNNVPVALLPIQADQRALKQILLNILTNAIKFTPKGGEVILSATAPKNVLIIEIRDTGIGIPEELIDNLTTAFVRGEPDPHISQEGSGLGLAIVKSLVDLHNGEMTIESEIGVGTTVTVTLPIGDT